MRDSKIRSILADWKGAGGVGAPLNLEVALRVLVDTANAHVAQSLGADLPRRLRKLAAENARLHNQLELCQMKLTQREPEIAKLRDFESQRRLDEEKRQRAVIEEKLLAIAELCVSEVW